MCLRDISVYSKNHNIEPILIYDNCSKSEAQIKPTLEISVLRRVESNLRFQYIDSDSESFHPIGVFDTTRHKCQARW